MKCDITRQQALELLQQYNKEAFHIQHALTVEGVMKWFANHQGFAAEAEGWAMVGLLHDIDFELYPEQHCQKAPELLQQGGVGPEMIHAINPVAVLIPAHQAIFSRSAYMVDYLRDVVDADYPGKRLKDTFVSYMNGTVTALVNGEDDWHYETY